MVDISYCQHFQHFRKNPRKETERRLNIPLGLIGRRADNRSPQLQNLETYFGRDNQKLIYKSADVYYVIIHGVFGRVIGFIEDLQTLTSNKSSAIAMLQTALHYSTYEIFLVCWASTSRRLVTYPNNALLLRAHVLNGWLVTDFAYISLTAQRTPLLIVAFSFSTELCFISKTFHSNSGCIIVYSAFVA
jgi:hypothetical protein